MTESTFIGIIELHVYDGKNILSVSCKEFTVKSKKLLTLIIAVAVLVVIVVVFISVFSVRLVLPVYHNFDGGQMSSTDGAPTSDDVLQFARGQNILFLSKSKLVEQLNTAFPEWHAIGIVKNFPNILEVHFVKRVAVLMVKIDGADVYLDSFGYVVDAPSDGEARINVTSAMEAPILSSQNANGQKLLFTSETNNTRLNCILESIMALWQCECEIEDIPTILGKTDNVFTFDSDGVMTITTGVGAKIRIMEPSNTLTDKLIDAFSVYCDPTSDLQKAGTVLEVYPDGKVTRK